MGLNSDETSKVFCINFTDIADIFVYIYLFINKDTNRYSNDWPRSPIMRL